MLRPLFCTLTATALALAATAQTATPAPSPAATEPANPYPSSSLGISLGWGAPYGFGLEYSHLLGKRADANVGAGLGLGGKIGAGLRYYFLPKGPVQPYAGINLVRSGRLSNVTITRATPSGTDETKVSISPSAIVHLRGGVRWQRSNLALTGTLGYGVVMSGGEYTYDDNQLPPSTQMRDTAHLFGPGGVEVSFGVMIGLDR